VYLTVIFVVTRLGKHDSLTCRQRLHTHIFRESVGSTLTIAKGLRHEHFIIIIIITIIIMMIIICTDGLQIFTPHRVYTVYTHGYWLLNYNYVVARMPTVI